MHPNLKLPFILIGRALILFAAYNMFKIFFIEFDKGSVTMAFAALVLMLVAAYTQLTMFSIMNNSNSFLPSIASFAFLFFFVHLISTNFGYAEKIVGLAIVVSALGYAYFLNKSVNLEAQMESFYQLIYYKVPKEIYFLLGLLVLGCGFIMLERFLGFMEIGLKWYYLYMLSFFIGGFYLIAQGCLIVLSFFAVRRKTA